MKMMKMKVKIIHLIIFQKKKHIFLIMFIL